MSEHKVYYSEGVEIIDLPVYLEAGKVSYKVIFSKGYNSVEGKLSATKKIKPFKLSVNDIRVTLLIMLDGIELKKVTLSIFDDIKYKKVSLKSTVSMACEQEKNVCSFELKLYIFNIDKNTNQANLLSLSEIERLAALNKLTIGYYIHRRSGGFSKTSKATLEKINNPNRITNKYIKYAMSRLKEYCNNGTQDFSRLMYRDLMKSVFEHFLINSSKPDRVIDEIGSVFGENIESSYMKAELLAFFHIYEALVPKTYTSPGYDKIQHFTYCTKKSYNSTQIGTDIAQYVGEGWDLINGGTWEDTKSDMEANNLGQAYGWSLYKKYHPIRAAVRSLD